MADYLVKLYGLPPAQPHVDELRTRGIVVRRALAPEKHIIVDWVRETFRSPNWASECEVSFARTPVACVIVVDGAQPVGFLCYDATLKGFIGPVGIAESHRRQGILRALVLCACHAMAEEGYGYAIACAMNRGARLAISTFLEVQEIPGSSPGVLTGMLRSPKT